MTLTTKMDAEGLVPAGYSKEDCICINAQEAATFVKKVMGGPNV